MRFVHLRAYQLRPTKAAITLFPITIGYHPHLLEYLLDQSAVAEDLHARRWPTIFCRFARHQLVLQDLLDQLIVAQDLRACGWPTLSCRFARRQLLHSLIILPTRLLVLPTRLLVLPTRLLVLPTRLPDLFPRLLRRLSRDSFGTRLVNAPFGAEHAFLSCFSLIGLDGSYAEVLYSNWRCVDGLQLVVQRVRGESEVTLGLAQAEASNAKPSNKTGKNEPNLTLQEVKQTRTMTRTEM